ncbi:MAG: cytochrome P450 [Acidobacteriales bacterium]|nr:cytochrome P450 [Terriglobales bacterium]
MTVGPDTSQPKPIGHPLGNLVRFRRDPLAFFTRSAREFGDAVPYRMGPRRLTLINHPDFIKDLLVTSNRKFIKSLVLQRAKSVLGEGLLTSEGEFHMRQRRLAQPAFHRQRIAGYGQTMAEYSARAAQSWRAGQSFDVHAEMMRLTLAIAGKTLFDADVESDAREIGGAMQTFMDNFGLIFLPFSRLLERMPVPPFNNTKKARARLDAIIYRIIAERRASGRDHGDLLSMLLHAQDVEGDGGRMTDEQVRDESLTLLLAGHETTANALTYAWILLAQNPEAESRLFAELNTLGDRLPTVNDLPNLRFTEMVFAETMRLYPPAWALGREALEDHRFGDLNIPKGSIVLCSQWVMHRDPRYHTDPERFDPDRWLPEAKAARPKFSYFPFGAGPRQCIGESFAWMEGVLVLATIARQWKLRLSPDFRLRLKPAITMRPSGPVPMTLVSRG